MRMNYKLFYLYWESNGVFLFCYILLKTLLQILIEINRFIIWVRVILIFKGCLSQVVIFILDELI